jgi:hypothetical protein
MENKVDRFHKYSEQRLIDKSAPRAEMFKVIENLKRSVDFYNSYGLKPMHEKKKPLA